MDDDQLLRVYVTDRSEAAFREPVRRHIGVAQRQTGIDAHLAEDAWRTRNWTTSPPR